MYTVCVYNMGIAKTSKYSGVEKPISHCNTLYFAGFMGKKAN